MKNTYLNFKTLLMMSLMLATFAGNAQKLPFQGKLLENGAPVSDTRTFAFSIEGTEWTESHTNVAVNEGLYYVLLGSITPLPVELFADQDTRQLNISVNGQALTPVNIFAAAVSPNYTLEIGNETGATDASVITLTGEGVENQIYRSLVGVSSLSNGVQSGVSGTGVSASTSTNNTYGVFGRASGESTTGQHRGVYGEAVSPSGSTGSQYGIYGRTLGSGTGTHIALYGESPNSPSGRVNNFGALTSANGVGKYNTGIRGLATGAGDGTTGFEVGSYNIGAEGFARDNQWGNIGVYGRAYNNPQTNTGVGVDNIGVLGRSEIDNGTTTIINRGMYADARGPGINYGIRATASNGSENWAGWFDGDVKITGNLIADGDLIATLPDSVVKTYTTIEKNTADVFYTRAKGDGEMTKVFTGLAGQSETTNGQNWGIYGGALKGNGANSGVRGFVNVEENPNPNFSAGVFGSIRGPVPAPQFTVGTYAQNVAWGTGESWGLGAFATSAEGTVRGIRARASSEVVPDLTFTNAEVYGAWIQANGEGMGNHYGGWFNAMGKGVNYGIRATASGGEENWAGWFDGDVKVTGNLSVDGGSIAATEIRQGYGSFAEKDWEEGLQGFLDLRGDAPENTDNIRVGLDVSRNEAGETFGNLNLFGPVYNDPNCEVCPRNFVSARAEKRENNQVSGRLDVAGPTSPNFSFEGKGWENSDFPSMSLFGTQQHPDGWYYNRVRLEVNSDGDNEFGQINFSNTAGGQSRMSSYEVVIGDPFNQNVDGVYLNEEGRILSRTVDVKNTIHLGNIFEEGNSGVFINKAQWTDESNNPTVQVGEAILKSTDGREMQINPYGISGNFNLSTAANGNYVTIDPAQGMMDMSKANLTSNYGSAGQGALTLFDGAVNDRITLAVQDFEGRYWGNLYMSNSTSGAHVNVSGDGFINLNDGAGNQTIFLNGGNGQIDAIALNQTSDARLKTNILPLNNALTNVMKMRGVSYNWIDKSKSEKLQIGVIAQEVEEVYPEFVHTNDEGMKSVNYSQMVAVLIEAIKELNTKVETLEAANTTLETKLSTVSQENSALKSSLGEIDGLKQQMKTLQTLVTTLVSDKNVTTSSTTSEQQ